MASLTLQNIHKTYDGGPEVLKGIDLEVNDGELMVFVGPSGCGKSTLLRMIAGLEDITEGELLIGGEYVNDLPPSKRRIAMVFQSYALYPHMTVAANMGFALKLAGQSKAEVKEAVGRAAEVLQISHLLDRKPKALSGGQRQRVAIGRAIVRKPQVFLFDEPLSNLDASLRVQMRTELASLHRQLGTTIIYVTHDQVEAMTLGQRIAVFNHGQVEQIGPPLALYEHPSNLFVAGFLGSPQMNLLPVTVVGLTDGKVRLSAGPGGVTLSVPGPIEGLSFGDTATLGFRPDHVVLTEAAVGGPPVLSGQVVLVERLGDTTLAHVQCSGLAHAVIARLPGLDVRLRPGDAVSLQPDAQRVSVFNASGNAVGR